MSGLSRKKTLLLLPILLATIVFIAPVEVPRVHALTGEVCLGDPTTVNPSSPCQSSLPVFSGPSGQQIRIGVYIQGSDPMDGFDLTLLTNQSFLVPGYVSLNTIDLTNTVLIGSPIIVALCVNGQLVSGTTCALTDKADTIHLIATSALGSPLTSSPTTGLLFTAIFNVTGTSTGSQPIGYQSGPPACTTQTSVLGLCVTIANGTQTPVVETAQTATFDNSQSATMPSVVLSANVTSFGPQFPGVSDHVNITATPGNGYMINSTNSVQFTSISPAGLTVTLSPSSCSTPGVLCQSLLTITSSAAGNYSVKVAGSYPTVDSSGNHDTLLSLVNVFVDVYDFGFTISPTTTSFVSGEIGSTTATLSSQNGFAGAVSLSTSVNVPAGLTVGYVPTQVTLSPGQTLTSTVTFKASTANTYHVRVNAAFGSRVKTSALLTVAATAPVPDFYIFAAPTSLGRVDAGVAASASVIVGYANGFAGTVSLSVSPSSLGSLNMTSLTGAGHNVTLTASSSVAKNYNIVVTAMNSTLSKSITFTLSVLDFNMTAAPNPIQVGQGSFTLTTVSVIPVNGFTSSTSLTSVQSTGLGAQLTPNSIVGSGTAILNVTAAGSTALGVYTVNVTGTSSTLQHMVQVNVTVVPSDFGISATPSTLSAYPGLNVNSTITLTSKLGFSGTITLSIQAPSQVTGLFNTTTVSVPKDKSGTAILTLTSTASGTFSVIVNATSAGGLKHSVTLSFTSNTDVTFSITNPYSQVTLSEGSTGSVPVTITSQNGFTGTITLAYAIIKPTGFAGVDVPNATLTPSTLSLVPVPNSRQNITVAITVRNSVVGPQIFGLNVTGTLRSLIVLGPTMTVNVSGPGFLIVSNPATATIGPGGTASFTVNVTAVNGLFGMVSLSPANLPSGVTCSPSSVSLLLKRDRSNTTGISCQGPVGSNTVTIAGSGTTPYGSTLPQSGTAQFVVASFSLSSTPTSFPINTGQQGNARINVTWTNSFNGNVTFNLVPQTGLTATIDSSKITGSGSTMVHVSSSTPGTYSLVVNATSGPYSKSVNLTVTISAVSGVSIDPVILYSGIGVGAVAVVAAAFLLLRRGKRSKTK